MPPVRPSFIFETQIKIFLYFDNYNYNYNFIQYTESIWI